MLLRLELRSSTGTATKKVPCGARCSETWVTPPVFRLNNSGCQSLLQFGVDR